jgi:hypothetical protein
LQTVGINGEMDAPAEPDVRQQFKILSSAAHLDVLIPETLNHDLNAVLGGSFDGSSQLPARRNLYFGMLLLPCLVVVHLLIASNLDEKANLLLVLKTSRAEDDLRGLLPSLEITLGAHATDAVPQGSGNAASASGKHDLSTQVVPGSEVANIITSDSHTIAIWKPTLHLSRPRVRLQRPAVYFTAYLAITAQALSASKQRATGLLESFQPLPANLLEPLHYDPVLSKSKLYLSESRISKVTPTTTRTQDDVKPIRGASKRAFPIVPAVFTRIRYSALSDAIIASLHLEISKYISGTLTVQDVRLDIPDAKIDTLSALKDCAAMAAGDETVMLYRLKRDPEVEDSGLSPMSVKIETGLVLEAATNISLQIDWQAQVDLSRTSSKPTYKWSRPLSSNSQQAQRQSFKDEQMPSLPDMTLKGSAEENGIVFTFSARPTVIVGQEFKLHIQCINRTNRARRFTVLSVRPKQNLPEDMEDNTAFNSTGKGGKVTIADLLKLRQAPWSKPSSVNCMEPDVRIGPLAAQAIFETNMRFLAMTTGPLDLGFIRVLDLDTRRTVDVKELPDVIALQASKETEGDQTDEEESERVEPLASRVPADAEIYMESDEDDDGFDLEESSSHG